MALTPKQQAFVGEYLVDLNATQAAIRAGYSPRTAKTTGHELLHRPEVAAAVEKAKAAREKRTGLSADWIVERAMRIADEAERDSDRIAALNLLSKHSAASKDFTPPQKHEHTGEGGGPMEVVIRTLPAES